MMKRFTILVVEDEYITIELIGHILSREYNIKVAKDGQQGYEVYKKSKPDIIITDIDMPKLSGIDMLRKIRETDQNVKAIMLTSFDSTKYLLSASELKLTKYLVKPISPDALQEAVGMAVEEIETFEVSYKKQIIIKDFVWNKKTKELRFKNEIVKLTPKEGDILQVLFDNINSTITYDNLISNCWGYNCISSKDSLKSIMSKLRKKLPENIIENLYGIGYSIKN
jgi:DNA-binding response OmpR family regulator